MSLIFPQVTVLMPVHNGEKHIAGAIESVLGQTFSDFKLLVVDDCSTDSSMDIVGSFGDARIKILKNDKNLGLSAALNRGIALPPKIQ
jgi:glycosyltransferase involved in cell wall biosynthesis